MTYEDYLKTDHWQSQPCDCGAPGKGGETVHKYVRQVTLSTEPGDSHDKTQVTVSHTKDTQHNKDTHIRKEVINRSLDEQRKKLIENKTIH